MYEYNFCNDDFGNQWLRVFRFSPFPGLSVGLAESAKRTFHVHFFFLFKKTYNSFPLWRCRKQYLQIIFGSENVSSLKSFCLLTK